VKSLGRIFWLTLAIACSIAILTGAHVLAEQMHSLRSDFTTDRLSPRVGSEVKSSFNSAAAAVSTMNAAHVEVTPEFATSTNEAIKVFNDAAGRLKAGESLEEADVETLDRAASDLRIKAEWLTKNQPHDPIVDVTVNTTDRRNKASSGCEVWYVTAFYEGVKDREGKFDQLSTPTSKRLMPGAYIMWTSRAGKRGDPKPVGVGDNHLTNMSVDLPAPR
jgi:hypothetical protein